MSKNIVPWIGTPTKTNKKSEFFFQHHHRVFCYDFVSREKQVQHLSHYQTSTLCKRVIFSTTWKSISSKISVDKINTYLRARSLVHYPFLHDTCVISHYWSVLLHFKLADILSGREEKRKNRRGLTRRESYTHSIFVQQFCCAWGRTRGTGSNSEITDNTHRAVAKDS